MWVGLAPVPSLPPRASASGAGTCASGHHGQGAGCSLNRSGLKCIIGTEQGERELLTAPLQLVAHSASV